MSPRVKNVLILAVISLLAGMGGLYAFVYFPGGKTESLSKDSFQKPYSLDPDTSLRYAVRYKRTISGTISNQKTRSSFRKRPSYSRSMELNGDLDLSVYKEGKQQETRFIGYRLRNLQIRSSPGRSETVTNNLSDHLKKEIFVLITSRGQILKIFFPPDLARQAQVFWQELLDGTVMVATNRRNQKSWTETQRDLMGTYKAKYQKKNETIVRERRGYERLNQQRRFVPKDFSVSSDVKFKRSTNKRIFREITGEYELNGIQASRNIQIDTKIRRDFTLTLQDIRRDSDLRSSLFRRQGVDRMSAVKQNLLVFDIGQVNEVANLQSPDSDLGVVLKRIQQDSERGPADKKVQSNIRELVGHIYKRPDRAITAIQEKLFNSNVHERTKKLLIAVLYKSSHVRAYSLIADIIRTNQKPDVAEKALKSVWMVRKPTNELKNAMIKRIQSSQSGDQQFEEVLRAAGILSSRFSNGSSGKAELFQTVLEQESELKTENEKIGFLDALGNSGQGQATEIGKKYLYQDTSKSVKKAAVRALQHSPQPKKSLETLMDYARERAERGTQLHRLIVRSITRIQSGAGHPDLPLTEADQFLSKNLLQLNDIPVRYEILSYFAQRSNLSQEVRNVLQKVLVNESNSDLRKKAEEALQGGKK